MTPAGVVSLKMRCIDDHDCKDVGGHSKYDQPSGQHPRLYGVNSLHTPSDVAAVVEGELSALLTTQYLGIPAVGTPGASHWMEHWPRVFADYERVLVIADNDQKPDGANPGLAHAKKVAKSLGPQAQLVLPPDGLDIDEWLLAVGVAEVKKEIGLSEST